LKLGGFERRLLIFFLLLSVTPTLLIAFFGARYFMEYFERVGSPALAESARNSMHIARTLQSQLEQDAAVTSSHLASEYGERGTVPKRGMQRFLQTVSNRYGADFVALYALDGTTWKMAASFPGTVERVDSTLGVEFVAPRDGPQKIVFTDQDVVVSGVRHGTDSVFVAGFMMDAGTMEMMRRTGEDLSRYSSMPLYVRSQGLFLVFIISAIVAIMAVSSIIVSRLIARRISHPIQELAVATERIARGDLEHRVDVRARDEIQSLVTAFNDMTQDLQEYKENLIRAERIAAWRDVARRIAHEIKNPLTPIEIAIYRIKKRLDFDREGGEVVDESLDAILGQVARLKTMAEEFSSFAKMPEPKLETLDLNEAVNSVLTLYSSSSEEVEIVTDFAGDLPPAVADPKQITGVVTNLVKNAVEAMKGTGKLSIRTSLVAPGAGGAGGGAGRPGASGPRGDAFVRVEIADTGPGIPEDIREKVFDPYFTTKAKGTGLGLALAYRIVEDHGGRIGFETGPGGTTFVVDLRVATATEDTA
jgi:nitrogen fixation/metabolism regulation signal transduction histidine kinase